MKEITEELTGYFPCLMRRCEAWSLSKCLEKKKGSWEERKKKAPRTTSVIDVYEAHAAATMEIRGGGFFRRRDVLPLREWRSGGSALIGVSLRGEGGWSHLEEDACSKHIQEKGGRGEHLGVYDERRGRDSEERRGGDQVEPRLAVLPLKRQVEEKAIVRKEGNIFVLSFLLRGEIKEVLLGSVTRRGEKDLLPLSRGKREKGKRIPKSRSCRQ